MLSQLLHLNGIESVVLERKSADYVLGRIRAGILESGTSSMLREAGAGARMDREGLVHSGIEIFSADRRQRIDLSALTVMGGAIGVGLGFGLQKIASNFISGVILLLEGQATVGDYVELDGGESGTIVRMGLRAGQPGQMCTGAKGDQIHRLRRHGVP